MKKLKIFFLITDVGFILYWLITILHIIPEALLFKDYSNPILSVWNWSFFPLDMCISLSGILCLFFYKKKRSYWSKIGLISLTLTFCSGLQAISFWAIRGDYDFLWWASNLYFMIYPLFFVKGMIKEGSNKEVDGK